MAGRFQDKVAFITGASSGIGAAVAEAFAEEGARVVLTARRMDRMDAVKERIEAAGGTALALPCDVTRRESIDAAIAKSVEAFGGLDVVLANAGFGVSGAMSRLETADYRRQFETNVFGLLDTVHAALPHLERSRGRLGLVSSVMGHVSMPASAPYCASKYAVAALAQCFYYDLADKGVSVTGIYPGIVASEIRSVNNQGAYTGRKDPAPAWITMPAEKAARQIVRALYRRKPECVVTFHGKLMVGMARHFPRTTRVLFRLGTKGRLEQVERAKRGDGAGE